MTPQTDALELLSADHRNAMQLCHALAALRAPAGSDAEKFDLVKRLCLLQHIHGRLEVEILYPGVRASIGDGVLVDQAQADDWALKDLIADVGTMQPADTDYDHWVELLCQAVAHHVNQQEEWIFPRVRRAGINLAGLGQDIAQRRHELLAQGLSLRARLASEDEAGDPVGHQ